MFNNTIVLYVEDEPELRDVVLGLTSSLFQKLHIAKDGLEGLELFKQYKDEIDLVVTDINMPRMDGLEMSQEIRDIDPKIPIIITTAHNDVEFLHRAISVGISEYVTKPMDMTKFIKAVQKCLEPILLQRKIAQKEKEFQEERLASAKFSALGQLSAGITHEINTPITYIKASFEMLGYDVEDLEDSKTKDNIIKNVERITDGLSRIENIISSMKEMSQQSKKEKESANIYATVITSAILAYNKIKHTANIYINDKLFDININKDEYQFMTNIHKQRVEQVWIVIINNAMDELIKIDGFENRRLDINISENENEVKVRFKDNAGGIKDDMMDTLFEPFKGSKESSGMGVGLSIAQKIIDEQNATIQAFNEDNGAVFEIIFKKEGNN